MIVSSLNLWCSKNLVDIQFLLGKFLSIGDELLYCSDPLDDDVELVFLNTCGFISSGRDEMFARLEGFLAIWKKVYLLGCAVQYFQNLIVEEKIARDVSEDTYREWINRQQFLSNSNVYLLSWEDAKNISFESLKKWFSSHEFGDFVHMETSRVYTNIDQWFEYLKIAEWCNNQCAFCVIPKIRGKQKSLPINTIVQEARNMLSQWAKEIILIAQDSTRYGVDIYGESALLMLLRDLEMMEEDFVVRVLYLYPDILTSELLESLLELKKFIPYFDIPLQHINPQLLKKMWRYSDVDEIRNMLIFIRENFENSYIRTNFIVWFPWETSEMVEELADFIGEWWFDNVALFEYHDEPLAPSFKYVDKIGQDEIHNRFSYLRDVWSLIWAELESERKKYRQVWYVQNIDDKTQKITVRPLLHAPEIDSVDEIVLWDIVELHSEEDVLRVGDVVEYEIN